jgi:hypothetical protein
MVIKERYYKWAGYISVPCVLVSFALPLVLGSFYNGATLIPGFLGLVLAASGLWKGAAAAKIFAAVSILIFLFDALNFISILTRY